ncbi:MAG TPA: DUF4282 domain-containing protein [Luteimonas sp.]|nr:DUF4282 domain-containing protein [Luteimonas sp.]
MRDLLFFDSMITPKIITFIYWILLAAIVVGALMIVGNGFKAMDYSVMAGLGMIFVAMPAYLVGSALLARVYCEVMIVLFRMNEALQEIRGK